jgi:hypothetical protein
LDWQQETLSFQKEIRSTTWRSRGRMEARENDSWNVKKQLLETGPTYNLLHKSSLVPSVRPQPVLSDGLMLLMRYLTICKLRTVLASEKHALIMSFYCSLEFFCSAWLNQK